jgi:hypothetical protein
MRLISCIALGVAGTAIASPARAQYGALPAAGSYAYALLPDSSDNIKDAVNRTVEPMGFIKRPIARGRLNTLNPTPGRVRVSVRGDTVGVAFDNGDPIVTPLDGTTVPWENTMTHETYQARIAIAGDTVAQVIAAPDGVRRNAYLFSDSAGRLEIAVTVTSHRLPGPLTYRLLFRRDSLP